MPNYQDGKIYKITAGNLTYFGSTIQPLSQRLAKHRNDKKAQPNSKFSSFPLLDMPDCKIILVEDYPCERREQLLAREAYYIENHECVNKIKPILTEEQKKQAKREEKHRYYQAHPEKKKNEKIRYFTKYPHKCPEWVKKMYNITHINTLPSLADEPESQPTPNPEPIKSASSRYKERQNRLKLIMQSKITFENI